MNDTALANAIRPKLSKAARERVSETIETMEALSDTQLASDIQFLLEFHDKVHAAAEAINQHNRT